MCLLKNARTLPDLRIQKSNGARLKAPMCNVRDFLICARGLNCSSPGGMWQ